MADLSRKSSESRSRREEHYATQRANSSDATRKTRTHSSGTGAVPPHDLPPYKHSAAAAAPFELSEETSSSPDHVSAYANPARQAQAQLQVPRRKRSGPAWPLRDNAVTTGSPQERRSRFNESPTLSHAYMIPKQYQSINQTADKHTGPADEHDLFRQSTVEEEQELNRRRVQIPPSIGSPSTQPQAPRDRPSQASFHSSAFDIPRPPPPPRASASTIHLSSLYQEHEDSLEEQLEAAHQEHSKSNSQERQPSARRKKMSQLATELYTISWLIFWSIWGVLARLLIQWMTFYSGAPVSTSVVWANFAGSLFFGYLAEDRKLFREEWGPTPGHVNSFDSSQGGRDEKRRGWSGNADSDSSEEGIPDPQAQDKEQVIEPTPEMVQKHVKVKKTLPLYIGLSTGFCGSLTSFSSFMRDCFLALSNDLPSPINHPYPSGVVVPSTTNDTSRHGGYSFEAIIATLLITICLSLGGLFAGKHSALFLQPITPTITFRFGRKILDRLAVILGFGCWIGAIILSIFPPNETWRGQAIFACVFAPAGCLLRFYASKFLNPISAAFPLGTFACNIFGTAVEGMAFDLQHVPLDSNPMRLIGGGLIACQVLQGIQDGFCGCLTTVSTWVSELSSLKKRHAYPYGLVSVSIGVGLMVIIMGSVRWTIGFSAPACSTSF